MLLITRRFPLTPQQQPFFRAQALSIDIADREAQNECPNQPQNDLAIAIHHILRANIRQMYTPSLDKRQGNIDVLEALDA